MTFILLGFMSGTASMAKTPADPYVTGVCFNKLPNDKIENQICHQIF